MSKVVKRFYSEIKPSHYELQLTPDSKSKTFSGQVTISLKKTGRPSQRLTFHQNGLTIIKASIIKHDRHDSRPINILRINNQNSLNEVRLHTSEMVYSGDYEVSLTFKGKITRNMHGLYPCFFSYKNEEHVILSTQFESHYARDVFPCIDEPEAKATFHLQLITPVGFQVLANTPIEQQTQTKYLLTTTFVQTPKMSTYLLAFVIGELHCKSTKTNRGTEISVWSSIDQPLASLDFALKTARQSVEFFEKYFGLDYPLPKLDHVALPDFSSGAMENWGLITYRERLLLAYPGQTSQSNKENIASVIAHETSHQWFGNLVTMRWWDDLWLNESFASLMECQAVDALFPKWRIWESFVTLDGLAALRRDAIPGVQAVKTNVHHPDEIQTLFDSAIVYAKGSRLLYMLKNHIGEEAFRKGLQLYFNKFAYANTSGQDLWDTFKLSSQMDIAAFMDAWVNRPGFPVLSVNQQADKIIIEQAHFLENGPAADEIIWPVPLFSNYPELPKLLSRAKLEIKLKNNSPTLLLNQGSAGHYIVNYSQLSHRQAITELVKQKFINVADRSMLLNSAGMLAKAGYQSFGDTLNLLAAYQSESEEAVWLIMTRLISESRRFIDLDEKLEPLIKQYVRDLINPEYQRLGWEEKPNETATDHKLRATIIALGAYADEPAVISEIMKRFKIGRHKIESLPAELRSIILGLPIKTNELGAFELQLKQYDDTRNSGLKSDLMLALSQTRNNEQAQILLNRLKDSAYVKPQDAVFWLVYLLGNRHIRELSWRWLENNWQWIKQTYAQDNSYDDFPRYAAGICNNKYWSKRYSDFFGPKCSEISLRRNIEVGLSEISTRVTWLVRDLKAVQSFFKNYRM
jgi:aminopeptidase N